MTSDNFKSQFVSTTAGAPDSFMFLSLNHMVNPTSDTLSKMVEAVKANPGVTASAEKFAGYVQKHQNSKVAVQRVVKPTTGSAF